MTWKQPRRCSFISRGAASPLDLTDRLQQPYCQLARRACHHAERDRLQMALAPVHDRIQSHLDLGGLRPGGAAWRGGKVAMARCQIAAGSAAFALNFIQSAVVRERTRKPSLPVNGEVFLNRR